MYCSQQRLCRRSCLKLATWLSRIYICTVFLAMIVRMPEPGSFEPPVTVIMLSPIHPGCLALRVTSASPRNSPFAPLGFYWIPTICLVSVYYPVRAVDHFNHWLNSSWHRENLRMSYNRTCFFTSNTKTTCPWIYSPACSAKKGSFKS